MPHASADSRSAIRSGDYRINGDYISVGDTLKLDPPFKGNKEEVLAFIGNMDTALAVINPNQEAILYKFVLTRINGETRTAINHRNLDSWTELKEFLQNSYIEKRTLDYHASQLFKARQGKDERVTDWIQRVQTLGSQFREATLLNCSDGAREGILVLSDRLRNICFVQGLVSDKIQTKMPSRNFQDFDVIAETALVEESGVASKLDRYRSEGTPAQRCNCGNLGHPGSKCYFRGKREARVNPVIGSGSGTLSQMICFRCGEKGHLASCRKPQRRREASDNRRASGNVLRWRAAARPSPPLSRLPKQGMV
jgi:hypothetical protein